MPLDRVDSLLAKELDRLDSSGSAKGAEDVVVAVVAAKPGQGPRYKLRGHGDKEFLRMNSNAYLGMSLRPDIIKAEEDGAKTFGAGPGAVRFISGTFEPHVTLEQKLAAFHGRPAAMIFSSAYATVVGTLVPLITDETLVISDELNHNCIINALRLSRPAKKAIYKHLQIEELDNQLKEAAGKYKRVIVVTDGIFSMRGDHAPLKEIATICRGHDADFEENVILMVDDSHGVGAYGATGRGTEEFAEGKADVLVGTLGKAFGVNGGYVVSTERVVRYLREKSPFYIYSNPITPGEATAASRVLDVVDSKEGKALLAHLKAMTARFEQGLLKLGYETIRGEHPVVPLMVRDTAKTTALGSFLKEHGILVTGLNYPVVPKGDESLRFQVSADHTASDIDFALSILKAFQDRE